MNSMHPALQSGWNWLARHLDVELDPVDPASLAMLLPCPMVAAACMAE